MLNIDLIDKLVAFLNEELKEMRLSTKDENIEKAPTVYDGYLPPKATSSRRGDDTEQEDYPFVIVRYLDEDDELYKENVATFRLVVGTYSKDEQRGWRDTLNVMNRIKITLMKKRVIGAAALTGKIITSLFEEQSKPMWHGAMLVQFNLPQVAWERSEIDDY